MTATTDQGRARASPPVQLRGHAQPPYTVNCEAHAPHPPPPFPSLQGPYAHPFTAGHDASVTGPLSAVPTFSPSAPGSRGVLDLLATAALTAQAVITPTPPATGAVITPTPLATHPTLSAPGPFNPAAAVPIKVVKRILDLEFVEIAEISVEVDTPQVPGRLPPPARPPITDISQWVERFSLMAAILSTRFPEKAPEFWAYQASIVRAERNYEGTRWVSYDRQFRREALARKDLNWSVTDPRLYNEAFTGRARAIARCIFCLQDDHVAAQCPQNPNRPIFTWCPDPASWSSRFLIAPRLSNILPGRSVAASMRASAGCRDASTCTRARAVRAPTRTSTALAGYPRAAAAPRLGRPVAEFHIAIRPDTRTLD